MTHSSDQRDYDDHDPEYMPIFTDEWVDESTLLDRQRRRMERRAAGGGRGQPRPGPGPTLFPIPEAHQPPVHDQHVRAEPPENDDVPAPEVNDLTLADPYPFDTGATSRRRGARPRYPVDRYVPGTTGLEQEHALLFSLEKKEAYSSVEQRDHTLI